MTSNETEKQYNELKKKYKLPEFKDIDLEFELSDLEPTNFLVRAIMRRLAEKLDFYSTLTEEVLQPDASKLYSMHENRFFDDEEKKRIYELYKRLMILSRHSVEVSLGNDEKEEANFINEFISEWKKIKPELILYARKMKEAWKAESDVKEDVGYMG